MIVLLSHASSYLTLDGSLLDSSFNFIVGNLISQSMVSLFLFYSGYGVMLSIDKKGETYVKSIPFKRVLKVLLHFDIAVILYLIVDIIIGEKVGIKEFALSLLGWDSIGNSNWYIFDILVLYLLTYVSFIIFKNNKGIGLAINVVLCGVFTIVMHQLKNVWWYDTVMCYAVGMIYYPAKPAIDNFVKKNKIFYWLLLLVTLGATVICFSFRDNLCFLILKHIFFTLTIVVVTMKFNINNKILIFLGTHLFSIYILQRLPMIVMSNLGVENKYLFVILSIAVTIPLALLFDFAVGKIDKKVFSQKKIQP